jgi:DNA modification methylase
VSLIRDGMIRERRMGLALVLSGLRKWLGENDMMAYLAMMSARLLELRRVLKPTGSLYLHCDPKASHYLKLLLDSVFGHENFRNEIIWQRTRAHGRAKKWGPIHDTILFYTVSDAYTWNRVFEKYERWLRSYQFSLVPGCSLGCR